MGHPNVYMHIDCQRSVEEVWGKRFNPLKIFDFFNFTSIRCENIKNPKTI